MAWFCNRGGQAKSGPGRHTHTHTTWTILQHDGPIHLGLWCNASPEHQMAPIGLWCNPAPCAPNGSYRLGLCAGRHTHTHTTWTILQHDGPNHLGLCTKWLLPPRVVCDRPSGRRSTPTSSPLLVSALFIQHTRTIVQHDGPNHLELWLNIGGAIPKRVHREPEPDDEEEEEQEQDPDYVPDDGGADDDDYGAGSHNMDCLPTRWP